MVGRSLRPSPGESRKITAASAAKRAGDAPPAEEAAALNALHGPSRVGIRGRGGGEECPVCSATSGAPVEAADRSPAGKTSVVTQGRIGPESRCTPRSEAIAPANGARSEEARGREAGSDGGATGAVFPVVSSARAVAGADPVALTVVTVPGDKGVAPEGAVAAAT